MTEITADSILANLRAGRDAIAAIPDDGSYVLMVVAYAICYREGAAMGTGVQHATRFPSEAAARAVPAVRNGKGERFWPVRIDAAKSAAIGDIDKAIAGWVERLAA
jgi:hypothetical protein